MATIPMLLGNMFHVHCNCIGYDFKVSRSFTMVDLYFLSKTNDMLPRFYMLLESVRFGLVHVDGHVVTYYVQSKGNLKHMNVIVLNMDYAPQKFSKYWGFSKEKLGVEMASPLFKIL